MQLSSKCILLIFMWMGMNTVHPLSEPEVAAYVVGAGVLSSVVAATLYKAASHAYPTLSSTHLKRWAARTGMVFSGMLGALAMYNLLADDLPDSMHTKAVELFRQASFPELPQGDIQSKNATSFDHYEMIDFLEKNYSQKKFHLVEASLDLKYRRQVKLEHALKLIEKAALDHSVIAEKIRAYCNKVSLNTSCILHKLKINEEFRKINNVFAYLNTNISPRYRGEFEKQMNQVIINKIEHPSGEITWTLSPNSTYDPNDSSGVFLLLQSVKNSDFVKNIQKRFSN